MKSLTKKQNHLHRATVFAHFDKGNIVDDYVYYYLKQLQKISGHIVFVSTAKLNDDDITQLSSMGIQVSCRANLGYDFMSYKLGIDSLDLSKYDELIICNDSVYGPLQSLEPIFCDSQFKEADVWGITDSHQYSYHLQSYFIVFRKKALNSISFKRFWDNVTELVNKKDIIEKYEVGLSKALLNDKLALASIYKSNQRTPRSIMKAVTENNFQFVKTTIQRLTEKDLWEDLPRKIRDFGNKNPTHTHWKSTILEANVPFLKVELIRENPMDVADINEIVPFLDNHFQYPTTLITNHLARLAKKT
ncbi:rhamnan synthesis F family protein [Halioxenophilus aromaticivorans]|uniref:Polysaccharide biosynthesis-like protein n=1 Tax=Halioxenophilus aromaticivorans TaxID=1306992 RepID=A0AAV3TYJ9_9ALTE